MSTDPNRWIKTLPFASATPNQEKYKLDASKWVNTLPKKDDDILILSKTIHSTSETNSGKKYSLTVIGFVVGLILVSVIKNETRNLQKEISNLQASINTLKLDLHQNTLEYEVITSPENISRLAKEYLESGFISYKKSQIKQLNEKEKTLVKLEEKKHKNNFKKKNKVKPDKTRLIVVKKVQATKTKLRKLQELYSEPKKLPDQMRIQVANTIETKKNELEKLRSDPYGYLKSKTRRWAGIQIVKVFLGIPVIPGR